MKDKKIRIEKDSMGSMKVPFNALYGAQTQRAVNNFPVSDIKFYKDFIYSIVLIKKSAVVVNSKLGHIDKESKNFIVEACNQILDGKYDDQFPVDIFQTGSGTSTNMNVNEVIANLSNLLGKGKLKNKIHPNDHVNFGQSSNDTIPTAINVSVSLNIKNSLIPSLDKLIKSLTKKEKEFNSFLKLGRTHLQDATPLTLGQEFSGYQSQLKKCIIRIENALKEIYHLAQGGTAVGTGLNTRKNFDKKIIKEISKITKLPFKPASNKFSALAAHDEIVNFSGTLNTTAVCLMKIANDIRFLGSGPRAGYGELILPANEPGSSIMPGKVNPTQSEAVTMVCVKVIGNHNGITMAGSHGHFELNVFKPLIAHNILQSIDLLADSTNNFALYCVKGIKADKVKIKKFLDNSLMLVTALAPHIGYDNSAKIAKTALKKGTTLREEALKTKLINEKDFDRIVNPKKMIYPK